MDPIVSIAVEASKTKTLVTEEEAEPSSYQNHLEIVTLGKCNPPGCVLGHGGPEKQDVFP